MRGLGLILRVFLAFWRQRRMEALALSIGLMAATALWTGVALLNAHARSSYALAEAQVWAANRPYLVAEDGSRLPAAVFGAARRAGLAVTPVLRDWMSHQGGRYEIIGLDPISQGGMAQKGGRDLVRLATSISKKRVVLASKQTAERLVGHPIISPDGDMLEVLISASAQPGQLIMDIGLAAELLALPDVMNELVLTSTEADYEGLAQFAAANRLKLVQPSPQLPVSDLAENFHLNLTAFSLLSYLVGLFIVYGAAGLAFERRRDLIILLRRQGLKRGELLVAFACEAAVFAALGTIGGLAGGYAAAGALVDNVGGTLSSLYGASAAADTLQLNAGWWLQGLAASTLGAVIAMGRFALGAAFLGPIRPKSAPETAPGGKWLAALTALLFALAGGVLLNWGTGLVAGFAALAAFVASGVAILPPLLRLLLSRIGRMMRGPLAEWFFADTSRESGRLALALAALMLALMANIGVGTMVQGFERTFTAFINERLAGDIYIRVLDPGTEEDVLNWLAERDDISAIIPNFSTRANVKGWPVSVHTLENHKLYEGRWRFEGSVADPWADLAADKGLFINEQLSHRADLQIGDTVTMERDGMQISRPVLAIYADYGNAGGQVRMWGPTLHAWTADSGGLRRNLIALTLKAGTTASEMIEALEARFQSAVQLNDQAGLKAVSTSIFKRTFAVTDALNVLTMLVAAIALFTNLLTLASAGIVRLTPIWALGLARRHITALEAAKIVTLALLTAVMAIPMGILLAWFLVAVINVEAFGWRLPLHNFPALWLKMILVAAAVSAVAALLPLWRFHRTSPHVLLRSVHHDA